MGSGLGLGLWIVRRLVELHEGSVEIASEGRGRGTRVEVRLPLAPAPVVAAGRAEAVPHGSLERLRVLLLEPDRAVAEALALVLEAADAEVSWVRAAEEARAPGAAPAPDAIVAAFDAAPEEAAELVRAAKARRQPPVAVALSTERTAEARARAHEAGFDALLARPFDPARLVHLLRSLREHRRTRVLVVDDDRDAADALALLLERHGFAASAAYGAEAALREASRRAPDAVVTDLRLGDGRGSDVARALRARGGRLRVVAVTGSELEDLGDEAALFDAFVRKPVAPGALVEMLRR
jgi:DNA-binding response OmpR family regulator